MNEGLLSSRKSVTHVYARFVTHVCARFTGPPSPPRGGEGKASDVGRCVAVVERPPLGRGSRRRIQSLGGATLSSDGDSLHAVAGSRGAACHSLSHRAKR